MSRVEGEISIFDQDIWYGKTSQEHSQAERKKEKTSPPSLKKSSKSQSRTPVCVCVCRKMDGQNPGVITLKMEDGALLGDYTMRSFGESPKEENASRLSQILQDSPPPKYSLSAKACQGILNRAAKRGKVLPPMLEEALIHQAGGGSISFQERAGKPGGGKGLLIQDEHTGALGTCQHQNVCAIGFDPGATRDVGIAVYDECSKTISNGTCPGHHNGVATYGFDPSASRDVGVAFLQECEKTVCAGGSRQGIVQAYDARGNGDGATAPTITGDHQDRTTDYTAIVLEGDGSRPSHQGDGYIESDTVYTLNSTEVHSVLDTYQNVTGTLNPGSHPGGYNGQDAYNDMLIAAVDFTNAVEGEVNGSLQASAEHNTASNNVRREGYIVRRLTPLECERLQGFPDGWTDIGEWTDSKGKKRETLDSYRYKALGNSIAVGYANNQSGFWMWLIKRISAQYERKATLGSLFDGIGGFPLAWEFYNGKGSAVWASEIEEFCIAVTKRHFPDSEDSCSQAVNVERERERKNRVFDNRASDARITECGDTAFTVSARYGTGGNNQPIVLEGELQS